MIDRADPLLAAVLADPDSDEARLMLGRALRERGDLQGELIELQINAASEFRKYGGTPEYRSMRLRAHELETEHAATWTAAVRDIAAHPILLRGLVEGVTLEATRFFEVAPELYKRAPIRQLILVDAGRLGEEIAGSEHLAQIVSLIFYNKSQSAGIGDAGVKAVAGSPHMRKLKRLGVARNDVGMTGLEALAASKRLPSLVYADLSGNNFAPMGHGYSYIDGASGLVLDEGFNLSLLGEQLEAKHGHLPWLHPNYPPADEDF